MRPIDVAGLPEYSGLFFDPATGKMYRDDGSDTGFTFEPARWTGPWGMHFSWPWLNPIGFATQETAERIVNWVRSVAPPGILANLDDTQRVAGPFSRTVERLIAVTDGAKTEWFSAGWIANSIIRNGEARAAESCKAEWRQAGLRF